MYNKCTANIRQIFYAHTDMCKCANDDIRKCVNTDMCICSFEYMCMFHTYVYLLHNLSVR